MRAWEKTGIAGLEARVYSKEDISYRLRQKINGKPVCDFLGSMNLEQATAIAAQLKLNRKTQTGAQTYAEMQELYRQKERATFIQTQKEEKALIEERKFLENHTVAKFWDNYYWPDKKQRGGEKSNKAILYTFNKYWRSTIGHIPIEELTYKQIEKVVCLLRVEGKSNRMVQYTYRILQAMYNFARIIFSSDFKRDLPIFCGARIKLDAPIRKNAYFTKEETQLLFKSLKENQCRDAHDMAVIALYSGLRFGDIKRLKWSDVREEEATPISTSKTGKVVYASLNFEPILNMLKERDIFSLNSKLDKLIFLNRKQEQYNAVPPIFAKTVKKLGFNNLPHRRNKPTEKVDFQTLRRTFASWLAQSGADLQGIRDLLGHNNIATTQIYAILNQDKTASLLRKLID